MPPRNAIALTKPWFEEAFARFVPDEDLRWALALITLVNPQAQEKKSTNPFISSIVLHIEVPGVVEGSHLATTIPMNMSSITEEFAFDVVRTFAEKLPAQRAAQQSDLEKAKAGRAPVGGQL